MISHLLSYKHIDKNITKLELLKIGRFIFLEITLDKTKPYNSIEIGF